MPEKSTSTVLKKVFDGISNTQEIFNVSTKLAELLESINFKDKEESKKFIEETKSVVDKFEERITSLHTYFYKYYDSFQNNKLNSDSDTETNTNGECNNSVVDDSFCMESDIENSVTTVENLNIINEGSQINDNVVVLSTLSKETKNKEQSDVDESTNSPTKENLTNVENKKEKSMSATQKNLANVENKKEKRIMSATQEKLTNIENVKEKSTPATREILTNLENVKEKSTPATRKNITNLENKREKSTSASQENLTNLESEKEKSMPVTRKNLTNFENETDKSTTAAPENLTNLENEKEKSMSANHEDLSNLENEKEKSTMFVTEENLENEKEKGMSANPTNLENEKENSIMPVTEENVTNLENEKEKTTMVVTEESLTNPEIEKKRKRTSATQEDLPNLENEKKKSTSTTLESLTNLENEKEKSTMSVTEENLTDVEKEKCKNKKSKKFNINKEHCSKNKINNDKSDKHAEVHDEIEKTDLNVTHVSVSSFNEESEEAQPISSKSVESNDDVDPLDINVNDDGASNDSTSSPKTNVNEESPKTDPSVEIKTESTFKIKCVDINKLLDPNAMTSTNISNINAANTSIVEISDSDNEVSSMIKKKIEKAFQSTSTRTRNRNKSNKTISQKKIIVLDDSDSNNSEDIRKQFVNNKEITVTKVKSSPKSKKDSDSGTIRRCTRARKKINEDLANVSSVSENSLTSSDTELSSKRKQVKTKRKAKSSSDNDVSLLSAQKDKKFSWKSYIPLVKIPAKTLFENYKKKVQKMEIRRLTNTETLKRSRRRNSDSSNASSDTAQKKRHCTEKKKKTKLSKKDEKKSKVSSNDSDSSMDVDSSKAKSSDKEDLLKDSNQKNSKKDEAQIAEMLLDGIQSENESVSSKADSEDKDSDQEKDKTTKNKRKEQKKKSTDKQKDKSDEEEDGSDDEAKREKKKWRKDKLLTENITESDSEEDFANYMKRKEKLNEKKRSTRRKGKNVLGSDSENSSASKNKSDSSSDQSKSSDEEKSSEEDDEESSKKKKTTPRKRIKRLKDSSDENGEDADKSTRKNIRKVWKKNDLSESTVAAEKEEAERKRRIAEKQKKYNLIFDSDSLQKADVDKVVLDFNDETEEEVLKVDKKIVKHLKPHQGKGIQFMWNACFESLERAKDTVGSGCILAHCMGLGKTLQVIALAHTLLCNEETTGVRKVLVVCPLSTVLNWVAEFKKWLPDDDEVEVFELVSCKQNVERMYQVKEWERVGGALIMGYDMFRNLTNPQNKRLSKKLRNTFHTCLVDPGPQLVICDEGHLLKNEKTSLSIAMNRLRTLRRIVLTGTPLQNNLKEYFCMVQFVKPNLLGNYREYLNRFVNPITNGQYTDSTDHDIQIMRKRSHVLHKLLDGVVERRDYSVLAPFLPPKHEYVLFVSLTELQVKLYQHYMKERSGPTNNTGRGKSFLFVDFNEFQRICTHPRVLMDKSNQLKQSRNRKDFLDDESEGSLKDFIDDEDEKSSSSTNSNSDGGSGSSSEGSNKDKKSKGPQQRQRLTRAMAATYDISDTEEVTEVEADPSEWWKQYCQEDDLDNISHSGKLSLLFDILKESEAIGDKVLVFSQSLYSLNVIEYFLNKIDEATQNGETNSFCSYSSSWSLGLDYFRLDGSSSCDNRAAWCKTFNDPENIRARLFLISTRAGGLGINLVAANRVIIFDVSWNPSHDTQSIYRVYRFGQTKPSYIYRFVTLGTMEMKVYERQVTKQAISKRVIDEQQIDRHYNQSDLAELYKFDPVPEEERPIPLVPKDVLLGELLQVDKKIYKYHEHQSLLENKVDEVLDEAERKAAWEEFENEKKARMYSGTISNIPVQSIIVALQSIIQKENPTWDTQAVASEATKLFGALQDELTETGSSEIFKRAVKEIRTLQAVQQQSMDDYYRLVRQQQLLMQQYRQQLYNQQGNPYNNQMMGNRLVNNQNYPRHRTPTGSSFAQASNANQNPVDYIDLND